MFQDVGVSPSWEKFKWWFTQEVYKTLPRSKDMFERNLEEKKNTKTHSLTISLSTYYGCEL